MDKLASNKRLHHIQVQFHCETQQYVCSVLSNLYGTVYCSIHGGLLRRGCGLREETMKETCVQRSTTIFLACFLSLHIQWKYSELIIKPNAPHTHIILLSFPLLQAVGAASAALNQTHANSLPRPKTHSVCKRPLGCHFQLACLPRTLISSTECGLVCLQTNTACRCLFLARSSNFFKKKLAPVESEAAQWFNCCYHQRQTIQAVTPPVYSNWRQLWHRGSTGFKYITII